MTSAAHGRWPPGQAPPSPFGERLLRRWRITHFCCTKSDFTTDRKFRNAYLGGIKKESRYGHSNSTAKSIIFLYLYFTQKRQRSSRLAKTPPLCRSRTPR